MSISSSTTDDIILIVQGIFFKYFGKLLCPLFKWSAHSASYQMKDQLKLNNVCSITLNKIFSSDVHNYNISFIQINLHWFYNFSTVGAFVRKPNRSLRSFKCPVNLSKIHAEIREILKFQKTRRDLVANNE